MNHIDDSAELYAIGALDDRERDRVDAHVATCPACARRLGEAERAAAVAIEADPQDVPSPALRARLSASLDAARTRSYRAMPRAAWFALAAAIAIAVVPAGFLTRENAAMHATVASDEMLMQRIADGSLASATFAPMKAATLVPSARVMYAKSGDFYAVVVRHPTRALHVAYVHPDGTMETIGTIERRGSMGVAVMPIDHKMRTLALVDGTDVVAEANLAFD